MIRATKKNTLIFGLALTAHSILATAEINQKTNISFNKENLECLAKNIYHEAKGEPEEGMVAVGIVTLNRVKHSKYPDSICKVVHQRINKCQFSWTCKKKIKQPANQDDRWKKSVTIASGLARGNYSKWQQKYKSSLHFHAVYVKPNWKKKLIAQTGRHLFYN